MGLSERYKPSLFNISLRHERRHLLFNSATANLMALNDTEYETLSGVLDTIASEGFFGGAALMETLEAGGFIVPEDDDEYEREHSKFLLARDSPAHTVFVVAPTMACNLACTYCFQKQLQRRPRLMSDQVQADLVRFFEEKTAAAEQVTVQWFGGEPLVALGVIRFLSSRFQKACDLRGQTYHAEMLTNGVLMGRETLQTLRELRVRVIQLTLDGVPATFADRKGIPLSRAESFHRFLSENMGTLLENLDSLVIRINVDQDNISEAFEITDWLAENAGTDPKIDLRLGFLNKRDILDCLPHHCFTRAEFSSVQEDFKRFLVAKGFTLYGFPCPKPAPCGVTSNHAYSVDPEGYVGRCVPDIGDLRSVHTAVSREKAEEFVRRGHPTERRYADFDPFTQPFCKGCALIPVCMGQCPKTHEASAAPDCAMKHDLARKLAFFYDYHSARRASAPGPSGSKKRGDSDASTGCRTRERAPGLPTAKGGLTGRQNRKR